MAKSPVITVGRSLPQRVWGLVKDVVPPMHAAGRPFVAGALTLGVFGWRYGWARRTSRRVHGRDDVPDQPPDVLGERGALRAGQYR